MNNIMMLLILIVVVVIILYFTGLGLLTNGIFNLSDCGCIQVDIIPGTGIQSLTKSITSGDQTVSGSINEIPLQTTITPLPNDYKINLNSTEVGISQMSVVVNWIINFCIFVIFSINGMKILINIDNNDENILIIGFIVYVIIFIVYIFYFVGLIFLSKAIFSLGDCGCSIVSNIRLGTQGVTAFINNQKVISIPLTPATISTIKTSNYRIKNMNSTQINFAKMALILNWSIIVLFIIILLLYYLLY